MYVYDCDGGGGGRKVNGQKMVYVSEGRKKSTSAECRSDIYKIYAKLFLPAWKDHILCTRRHTRRDEPYDFALW